jgi:citrate lyase subunit beta/citryl-CoA lyase
MDREARSLLFVPGDRPDRFGKAAAAGAHEIIIDLEDAVSPANKRVAREALVEWLKAPGRFASVRVNAAQTPWFRDDLDAVRQLSSATVMLAKADIESLSQVAAALPGCRLIALLETVKGYMELRQMVTVPGLSRIAFGSIDFGVDAGISDQDDAMTPIRTQIVLESRYAQLQAPVDGVSVNFKDEDQMRREASRSRQLGFGGKLCIHPRQVVAVNSAFTPDAEQVDWAQRVIAAFEASQGGATTVDGKMVDKPLVVQARQIMAEITRID